MWLLTLKGTHVLPAVHPWTHDLWLRGNNIFLYCVDWVSWYLNLGLNTIPLIDRNKLQVFKKLYNPVSNHLGFYLLYRNSDQASNDENAGDAQPALQSLVRFPRPCHSPLGHWEWAVRQASAHCAQVETKSTRFITLLNPKSFILVLFTR